MTLREFSAKINIRLNKDASFDYDNIWKYIKKEATNKAITDSVRRIYRGKNQTQEGDEETVTRIDDLQILLKTATLSVRNKGLYAETLSFPTDYLYYKRLTPIVSKADCSGVQMKSHLKEEANVDNLLTLPSFAFEETFNTLLGNKSHVYHGGDFTVDKVILTYYKKPKKYDFNKLDTVLEFKDDVCELFVDETCKIISSDIESLNAKALAQERRESND